MEIQLQELLERIHSEGIENAKQQAEQIIQKAQSEAAEIIARAKRDAEEMQAEALRRIDAMEAASRESLLQASRDTMIANVHLSSAVHWGHNLWQHIHP